MKHIKTYEKNYLPSVSKGEEYMNFFAKELEVGRDDLDYLDYSNAIKMYITRNRINDELFRKLYNYFEDCEIFIETLTAEQLTIHVIMPDKFLKKVDIQMDTHKYNL